MADRFITLALSRQADVRPLVPKRTSFMAAGGSGDDNAADLKTGGADLGGVAWLGGDRRPTAAEHCASAEEAGEH